MTKRINSKTKGNNFERKIANVLSARFEIYTGKEKSFRRSQDSGSFFGGSNQYRKETHDLDNATFGDIVTPSKFIFTVECKHYKDAPTMNSLVLQNCKMFDEWISQAEQDSTNSGKKFIIIAKFNNVAEIVIINELFGTLSSVINYKNYFVVNMEDFLKQNDEYFFI